MNLYSLRLLSSSIANTPEAQKNFSIIKALSVFDKRFFGDDGQLFVHKVKLTDGEHFYVIPHIVLLPYGIFVVSPDTDKDVIRNTQILEAFLGLHNIHPLVIITSGMKPKNAPDYVVNLQDVKSYVKAFNTHEAYSRDDLQLIQNKLIK